VSKVRCGSAFGPGASGLPYYCAPFVLVLNSLGGLAVWWLTHKQTSTVANPRERPWLEAQFRAVPRILTCRLSIDHMLEMITEETVTSDGSGSARLLSLITQQNSSQTTLSFGLSSPHHRHEPRTVRDASQWHHYHCLNEQAPSMHKVLLEPRLCDGTQSCLYHIVAGFLKMAVSQVRQDLGSW